MARLEKGIIRKSSLKQVDNAAFIESLILRHCKDCDNTDLNLCHYCISLTSVVEDSCKYLEHRPV